MPHRISDPCRSLQSTRRLLRRLGQAGSDKEISMRAWTAQTSAASLILALLPWLQLFRGKIICNGSSEGEKIDMDLGADCTSMASEGKYRYQKQLWRLCVSLWASGRGSWACRVHCVLRLSPLLTNCQTIYEYKSIQGCSWKLALQHQLSYLYWFSCRKWRQVHPHSYCQSEAGL